MVIAIIEKRKRCWICLFWNSFVLCETSLNYILENLTNYEKLKLSPLLLCYFNLDNGTFSTVLSVVRMWLGLWEKQFDIIVWEPKHNFWNLFSVSVTCMWICDYATQSISVNQVYSSASSSNHLLFPAIPLHGFNGVNVTHFFPWIMEI